MPENTTGGVIVPLPTRRRPGRPWTPSRRWAAILDQLALNNQDIQEHEREVQRITRDNDQLLRMMRTEFTPAFTEVAA